MIVGCAVAILVLLSLSIWLGIRDRSLAARLTGSEQRAAGAERQSAALRAAADASSEILIYHGIDATCLAGNRAVAEWIGRPIDEIVGKPLSDFLPSALAQALSEQYRAAIAAGAPTSSECWCVLGGAAPSLFRISSRPFKDRDGIASVLRDITGERRDAEKLHIVWQNAEDFMVLDTPSTGAVEFNQAIRRLFEESGEPPGSLADASPRLQPNRRVSVELLAELAQCAVAVAKGEEVSLPALPACRVEGGSLRFEWTLGRDGAPTIITEAITTAAEIAGEWLVLTVLRDITARRDAEVTMRAATELVEHASRVKSGFFANLSHEVRTPMNAVIGLSNLLLKTELTAHQRGYLSKIQQASQMLLGIVNDILDFSRLDAGKLALERTLFEPDEILDRVANLIGGKAAAKGLELVFNIDPRLDFVLLGDPLRLSQIFVNYIDNAVKFTEQGEVELIVDVREEIDDEVLLYCAVRDSGIGLSTAQQATLFQPFQQADNSMTRRFGGTGLGLVISKNLAEAMGGAVGVESMEGVGSTFWFTARLGKRAIANRATMPMAAGIKILVVDDHPRVRDVVGSMLAKMGFLVRTASSGREAVITIAHAAAAGAPYGLVLLDAELPDIDGFAVAAQVKALGVSPAPHIVLMIGAWGEEVTDEARQVGIEYTLPKPFTASLLLNIIAHVLHDPSGTSAAAPFTKELPATALAGPLAGRRILLVEDNDVNQEVGLDLLVEFGFVVEVASDGAVAVEKVLGNEPDYYAAVLMDVQMPVMDGLTATRTIRRSQEYADLPIIAMTANGTPEDHDRCLEAGMNDHLVKPNEPQKLHETLERLIGGDIPAPAAPRNVAAPQLPEIAGLDASAGLRRMMGNTPNYLALLGRFAGRYDTSAQQIEQALKDGDRALAERLSHTLKGVAAGIGADLLAARAATTESGIRAGGDLPALATDLDRLRDELFHLVAGLRTALSRQPAPLPESGPRTVDQAVNTETARQLAELLAEHDVAAITFLTKNSALLRDMLGEHFCAIETAAQDFEFAEALATLRMAAGNLEIML
ncbi:MAG TPA: response regulator [Stellaceae bacterium]|nr:response regulator [Stellaceae bacterium]